MADLGDPGLYHNGHVKRLDGSPGLEMGDETGKLLGGLHTKFLDET